MVCFRLICGRNLTVFVRCKWWGREVGWFRVGRQFHLLWLIGSFQPTVVAMLKVVVVLQSLIRIKLPIFLPALEGGSYLVYNLGLQRTFILWCFAGRGWYTDLLCVDDWSIHRGLDLYLRGCYNSLVLFLIFILPVWVYLHCVDKLVKFMYPSFLCIFFSFFNNIFMSIWQEIKVGYQLSWEPLFFLSFAPAL